MSGFARLVSDIRKRVPGLRRPCLRATWLA
jgi:hypothetical protein